MQRISVTRSALATPMIAAGLVLYAADGSSAKADKTVPVVAASAIVKEFVADADAAKKKYDDKEIIVEGRVKEAGKDKKSGSVSVVLAGIKKTPTMTIDVRCTFPADAFPKVKDLKTGDTVRIRGTNRLGLLTGEVALMFCTLEKADFKNKVVGTWELVKSSDPKN